MVRFDVFTNDSIRLVITGVGEINAAAAVSNIGGAYGISPDDEILNVGCGAGFSSDICLGSIFLGNKLTEQMTGRTFYPDMLMKAKSSVIFDWSILSPASETSFIKCIRCGPTKNAAA